MRDAKFCLGAPRSQGMAKIIDFPKKSALGGLERAVRSKLDGWMFDEDKNGKTFMQLEEELEELFREAQREVLGEALAAADIEADGVVYDGAVCRRVLSAEKEYMTSSGPVVVRRALFKDRGDPEAQSFAALDKRVGIVEGFWTPKAAREALWMVTQMVPSKAAEAFERIGSMAPSKSSLDRLPKELAERWEHTRGHYEQALIATQTIPKDAATIAVSLDGVYAPIEADDSHVEKREAKHAKGIAARGPDAFREIGCASIAFYDSEQKLLGAIRFGRGPEYKKLGVKAMLAAELRGILDREPTLDVVFLSDGAPDHWEFFESLRIPGEQALDFFHAAEHLNAALGAAYGEGSIKARRRFAELRHILLEESGGASYVRRSLKRLAKLPKISAHRTRMIERAVRYFEAHAARMRYSELRARNMPIGSGVMEASCKTLVAQRLKLSGQRWSEAGVQAILTPRGWDQSDRFDEAFALVAATYQRPVTIFTPVARRLVASR